jgi:glutamate-1-semialdehyde 2,1-aminomutase
MNDLDPTSGVGESESRWRELAVARLLNPSPNRHRYPASAPWYFSGAHGHWLTTTDGQYLDLYMGRGTSVLGYSSPHVLAAARDHLEAGFLASLRHPVEVELAGLICDLLPSAQKVLFAKNGSDACTLAVRAARAATGRDMVLSSGFHGFGDVYNQGPKGPGFPRDSSTSLIRFDPSTPDSLADLVATHAADLAAVVLDPMVRNDVHHDTLVRARELTSRHGAILIFDEVVTGFRVHVGGAQTLHGVTPDLTCLGKVMGNGYPLSCLAGDSEVMDALIRTSFSSTYQSESLGCAIALSCLRVIVETKVPATLAAAGEELRAMFDRTAAQHGVDARALGPPSRLELTFGPEQAGVEDAFVAGLAAARVVPSLAVFVSAAFGDSELHHTEHAFTRALADAVATRS